MLRDVLLRQTSTVLREGPYAIPALMGATVLVLAQRAGSTSPVFPVAGALVCVVVRLVGLKYDVALPTPSDHPDSTGRRRRVDSSAAVITGRIVEQAQGERLTLRPQRSRVRNDRGART
jgi:hypothetical protein